MEVDVQGRGGKNGVTAERCEGKRDVAESGALTDLPRMTDPITGCWVMLGERGAATMGDGRDFIERRGSGQSRGTDWLLQVSNTHKTQRDVIDTSSRLPCASRVD